MIAFSERLRQRARERRTWLCVGLDPDLSLLPSAVARTADGVVTYCREIVATTAQFSAAFKINFAFYEALGPVGWEALRTVRDAIPAEIPVIADAKRGDIDSTARAYARAILEVLDFDAVTVSPYLGWDSVAPFTAYAGKGVLILCKTSNPGASQYQDVPVDGEPLYIRVARGALSLASQADVGLVVGATQPEALRQVRSLSEDVLLLVPGVGAQGASAGEAVALGANACGENALISISREILYASSGRDYAAAAGERAEARAAESWKGALHADR
jgi:orotidine-5'-phosphate decarboxylase